MNMNLKPLLLLGCLALPVHFVRAQNSAPAATAAAEETISGKVAETIATAGYTYVLVDHAGKKDWAAAPEFAVKVGDTVSFAASMPMVNYHSKSLNRDFAVVYFAASIAVNDSGTAAAPASAVTPLPPGHPPLNSVKPDAVLPPGHPALAAAVASPNLDLSNVKRAEGGKLVQEIISGAAKLTGTEVTVRGKVVKYNAGILGKNWLHIQDGSGSAEKKDNDLLVTTVAAAKVGDTVLVAGKIAVNQDFGAGYKYAVMLADAQVTVE